MDGLWSATLDPHSPRYEQWKQILDSEIVPLQSPASGETQLGEQKDEVYLISWEKMTAEQRQRLCYAMAEKFQVSPYKVQAEIEKNGHFPIRSADVIVAFSLRAFI